MRTPAMNSVLISDSVLMSNPLVLADSSTNGRPLWLTAKDDCLGLDIDGNPCLIWKPIA